MRVLHLWAVGAGALAVGLPVLIHFLTRPRPVRMSLSTVRFAMEVVRQRRARYRLRDWLVLLLRAAAVALLAWAFARPLTGANPAAAAAPSPGGAVRVVVLDQSQSMAAVVRGVATFEKGRTIAARELSGADGLRGNLVLAGARPPPVVGRFTRNLGLCLK
jgi:hypothetical protein